MLGFENDRIDFLLLIGELSGNGYRSCNIGRIVVIRGADIQQEEIAFFSLSVISRVMQNSTLYTLVKCWVLVKLLKRFSIFGILVENREMHHFAPRMPTDSHDTLNVCNIEGCIKMLKRHELDLPKDVEPISHCSKH